MKTELSPRQTDIFNFIRKYQDEEKISPSICDIGAALGLATSTVAAHISAMKRKGAISSKDNTPRSFVILKDHN